MAKLLDSVAPLVKIISSGVALIPWAIISLAFLMAASASQP